MDGTPQVEGTVRQPASRVRPGAPGSALVAIAALGALLDAAIETLWSGSPLRWWIAPPVIAFVAICVWLWRPRGWLAQRSGWPGAAVTSAGGLLALLAASAWLPGGQVNGARMFLQPTSALLAVATAAAVILAAFVVVQGLAFVAPTARLIARGVFIALALYALVALAFGILDRAPYAALFQGGAVWQRLPRWLQGSFIGATVLLPVAILAQVVRVIEHLRRQQPIRVLIHQTTALVMALVMATSGVALPSAGAAAARTSGASPGLDIPAAVTAFEQARQDSTRALMGFSADTVLSGEQAADRLDAVFGTIEELMAKLPRDTFDVAAVVDQVGQDPSRLFQWVRDETTWVPYRGTLRGPIGVLMDRRGNSLDRALLLAALLNAAGRNARLAHGTLAQDQVTALMSAVHQPRNAAPGGDDESVALAALAKLSPANTDVGTLRSMASARREAAVKVVVRTREAAEAQSAMLLRATGNEAAISDRVEAEAAADHWWVQVEDGSNWTDLDPSLPASAAGATLTSPSETIQPDALARALRHEVGIRIVVEQLAGGKRSEHVALEESVTPAEIIGQPVRLANVPLSVKPTAEQIRRGPLPEMMLQWAKAEKVWLPLLTVGARNIAQKVVATTGELTRLPVKPSNPISGAATGQSVSSMSGFLGGEETPAPKAAEVEGAADGELTAEWIEYEIRVPGQPPRSVRREVFDLIGPEARQTGSVPGRLTDADRAKRATSLLTHTEAVLLAGGLSIEYVEWLRARALLANRKWLTRWLRQPAQDPARAIFETLPDLQFLPGPEFDLAVVRDGWSPVADATYLAEPNIIAFHRGLSEGAGGALAAFNAYDIVWNHVAVMPSRRTESFGLRVRQGTLDSIAEEILIGGPCCGSDGSGPTATLPALGVPGADWKLVRSADDTRDLPVPAATRARIAADVAGGFAVVAPTAAAAGPIVWWRIDKVTGQTLAIGDRGWGLGGPAVERSLLEWARESLNNFGAMHFVVELTLWGLCVVGSLMQGAGHESAGSAAVGIALCTIAAAFGLASVGTSSAATKAWRELQGINIGGTKGFGSQQHIIHSLAWAFEAIHIVVALAEEGIAKISHKK